MFTDKIRMHSDMLLAVSDTGDSLHYGELGVLAEKLRVIIKERSLVFCLVSNSIESIAGYIGVIASENVPLLLDIKIDKTLLESLLTIYEPQYIWRPCVDCGNENDRQVVFRFKGYELVKRNNMKIRMDPELGLLLSTSGSTGSAKLVRLSYKNIESNARSISEYLGLSKGDRPITTLPMHYSYGVSVIHSHFYVGATILVTDKSIAQKEFWKFFSDNQASSIAGVPFTYEMLKRFKFFSMELPTLRVMTQAGGHLSIDCAKEFLSYTQERGIKFYVMYGQTEATARMAYLDLDLHKDKIGSIGKPIPGGSFCLTADDGAEIHKSHITGNLIYKGQNVSMGYAQSREDLALPDLRKGVLDTGDLAHKDDDGFYIIDGRKSRFVKIYGNRISLDEIEVLARFKYEECACLGKEDLITIYVTTPGLEGGLRKHLATVTGINPRAFKVEVVSSLPRSASGKIQYGQLGNSKK